MSLVQHQAPCRPGISFWPLRSTWLWLSVGAGLGLSLSLRAGYPKTGCAPLFFSCYLPCWLTSPNTSLYLGLVCRGGIFRYPRPLCGAMSCFSAAFSWAGFLFLVFTVTSQLRGPFRTRLLLLSPMSLVVVLFLMRLPLLPSALALLPGGSVLPPLPPSLPCSRQPAPPISCRRHRTVILFPDGFCI